MHLDLRLETKQPFLEACEMELNATESLAAFLDGTIIGQISR